MRVGGPWGEPGTRPTGSGMSRYLESLRAGTAERRLTPILEACVSWGKLEGSRNIIRHNTMTHAAISMTDGDGATNEQPRLLSESTAGRL
jgi:hypothetical protein